MNDYVDPLFAIEDARLAERFHKVARWLCSGYSDQEIAKNLGVRRETVWGYIKNMVALVGARNRSHLVCLYTIYCLRGREDLIFQGIGADQYLPQWAARESR